MKRRLFALAACLLLILSLGAPSPAQAAESFHFVAISENVLPLTDSTMPFWSGGYLYIASSIFTGAARDSLDISYSRNDGKHVVVLYRRGGALLFDTETLTVQDGEGTPHSPGAIVRGGTVFVPAALVAGFFNLDYSVYKVNHGSLIWLRQKDFSMSESAFLNAAAYPVENRYQRYMQDHQPASAVDAPPEAADPSETLQGRQKLFLCLSAQDHTAQLLDELDRRHAGAAIFCTPSFMEENAPLLRRMVAAGYAIGIEADTLEQLEEGNRLLEQATLSRTRFARMSGAEEAQRSAAQEAGWCLLQLDVDRSGYDLRTSDQAQSLLQRIAGRTGEQTVYLGENVSPAGLRSLLQQATEAEDRCLTLTELQCR